MTASLYILQHGKAVSREIDPLRPLSDDGREDVERLAKHLAGRHVSIQHIIHSSKLRAEQTAEIISLQLAPDVIPAAYFGTSPSDNPESFIDGLDMSMGNILMVSHMPFVSRLCSVLLTGNATAVFEFTPGSLACMNYEDGVWSMAYMLRPDIL